MKKKKKKAAAPKKAAKKVARGTVNKVKAKAKVKKSPAAKPKKQKKTKPSPAKKSKKPSTGAAPGKPAANVTVTPNICVANFSAANGDAVQFQSLPIPQVNIMQVEGNVFPFTPVTGTNGGLEYATVTSASSLIVSVPAINKTYPYKLSCTCPGLEGTHSITVNS